MSLMWLAGKLSEWKVSPPSRYTVVNSYEKKAPHMRASFTKRRKKITTLQYICIPTYSKQIAIIVEKLALGPSIS